jgi:hypothetical protein
MSALLEMGTGFDEHLALADVVTSPGFVMVNRQGANSRVSHQRYAKRVSLGEVAIARDGSQWGFIVLAKPRLPANSSYNHNK